MRAKTKQADTLLFEWRSFLRSKFLNSGRILYENGAEKAGQSTDLSSKNTWQGKAVSVMQIHHGVN